jgi:hypothetical protein
MNKILLLFILPIVVLSLSFAAAGQAAAPSLDDQMFQAIEKGDFTPVIQLLDQGAHIDAQGKDGVTVLIAATAMGKADVVKLLLEKGANTDIKDARGDTALHYAVMISNIDEVKLLLAKGANVNVQEEGGLSPLWRFASCCRGKARALQKITGDRSTIRIEKKAEIGLLAPSRKEKHSITPLF